MTKDLLRIVCFNPCELKKESKRKVVIQSGIKGRIDMSALSATYFFEEGVAEGENENECGRA